MTKSVDQFDAVPTEMIIFFGFHCMAFYFPGHSVQRLQEFCGAASSTAGFKPPPHRLTAIIIIKLPLPELHLRDRSDLIQNG